MFNKVLHRVREAIAAGGGQFTAGAFLGGSASHVVCLPSAASQWLAMGKSFKFIVTSAKCIIRTSILSMGDSEAGCHVSNSFAVFLLETAGLLN